MFGAWDFFRLEEIVQARGNFPGLGELSRPGILSRPGNMVQASMTISRAEHISIPGIIIHVGIHKRP